MSLYDILELHEKCTIEEIESLFKKKIRKVHPTITKQGADEFVAVNQAYKILRDKYKRQFYDLIGDPCLYILEKEKESFVIVRMFDRTNVNCFLLFLIFNLFNLVMFPFFYFFKKQIYILFSFFSCNIFLVIINLRNALRIDYEFYKIVIYFSVKYFTYTLSFIYFNIFSLIILDIGNIFLNSHNVTTYLNSTIVVTNILFLKLSKFSNLNMLIIFISINILMYIQKAKSKIYIFSTLIFILYFSTIFFINSNYANWIIFIPHIIFTVFVISFLAISYKYYRLRVPKYTLKSFSNEQNFSLV